MPHFMVQGSYTADAWAKMIQKPEDREKIYRKLIEKAGGKLKAFYFAFGEKDVVAILEVPDAATAGALSLAVMAPGHVRHIATTPLMTVQEGMEVMRKASELKYQGPTG
ncbi:MAG TPA: GYD domain-containing protein [Thermoanaerobaculia bacterium]|nr:GYD domain-containing protein [Thermoanaerobaculia bacterium]